MYYKMDNLNRGEAIIFNHEHFVTPYHESRRGTQFDCSRIDKILENIGFDVKICNDYRYQQIIDTLKEVAKKDHSKNDCLLVVIMSHGRLGAISASDIEYKPELLYNCFTTDECPSLIDKPKLFFIQACPGEKCVSSLSMQTVVELKRKISKTNDCIISATNSNSTISESISYTKPDFLIVYSTVPGYYSWKFMRRGTWFIQELCDELDKNVFNIHILKILTNVNRNLAAQYERYVPEKVETHQQKQIPCISSTLTRILQFTLK